MTTPTPTATPKATPTPTATVTPSFTPIAGGLPAQVFFVLREIEQIIEQYTVGTNNILSTMYNDDQPLDVSAEAVRPQGIFTLPAGNVLFVLDDNINQGSGAVYRYDSGIAWDTNGFAYSGNTSGKLANPENAALVFHPADVAFDDSGNRMYILDDANDRLFQYSLGSANDLTTLSYTQGEFLELNRNPAKPFIPLNVIWGNLGTKLYIVNSYNNSIDQYGLSSNYDITTATFEKNLNLPENIVNSVSISADGSRMFVDTGTNFVSYNVVSNWEIDTAARIVGYDGQIDGRSRGVNLRQADAQVVTPTPTASVTPTVTATPSVTPTLTPSATAAVTPTVTPTISITPSVTASVTPTVTPSVTPTGTAPVTPTVTPTISATPSVTATVTPTVSAEVTPTVTPTISVTPSVTVSAEVTPTVTPTISVTPSNSPAAPSPTPTSTVTATPAVTPTISVTPSVTGTPASTPAVTPTISVTPSVTGTPAVTPTVTPTVSVSQTPAVTPTVTPTTSPPP